MHRTGLNLILQGMPSNLGAYHEIGSNAIVANKHILDYIRNTKSKEDYNAYVFSILAHEYIHSLGIVDESVVRNMIFKLCEDLFGKEHTTTQFAIDPLKVFPHIQEIDTRKFEKKIIHVKKFDQNNTTYIQ